MYYKTCLKANLNIQSTEIHSQKKKKIPESTARLLCPWNSPGKNTGLGCHSLLQGIFPTQGLNLGLLHCRQILYHLSHQGSPSTDSQTHKSILNKIDYFKTVVKNHYTRFSITQVTQFSSNCGYPGTPALQADSLLSEPPGKPTTIVRSL